VSNYSISQNYLTSAKTIRRLLRLTSINGDDHILEIGAGKGHITRELVKVGRAVSAYEIDRKLYGKLKEKLGGASNLSIRRQDFLKAALPSGSYKVFSNIPFCITSKIVRKLTTAGNPPREAWLVMEKGAAKRFSAQLKPRFEPKIVYYFVREDFHPAPGVDIVLLRLTKRA
jgi:23S rRNA (adenine-N6)-dimethyltransferase